MSGDASVGRLVELTRSGAAVFEEPRLKRYPEPGRRYLEHAIAIGTPHQLGCASANAWPNQTQRLISILCGRSDQLEPGIHLESHDTAWLTHSREYRFLDGSGAVRWIVRDH
jgi:hypothetical protein